MDSSTVAREDEVRQYLTPSSSLYNSAMGLVVFTTITAACLSAMCSGVNTMVICKLKTRLRFIYHRILFFISTSDVLASTAVALTTSVMPKYIICKNNTSPAAENWPVYGIEATCKAQGFIVITFNTLTFFCDVIFCIYYLCSIKFRMNAMIFSSRLEGLLYFLAIAVTLNLTLTSHVKGNINPSKSRHTFVCSSNVPI